jgi:hypothetical protein
MPRQTVSFAVVCLLLLSNTFVPLAQASSEAIGTDAVTEVADVCGSSSNVSASDGKEIRRPSQHTVSLRDTGEFNVDVPMLQRKDVREQHAKLTAAIATEEWPDGFVMAVQIMAAFAM